LYRPLGMTEGFWITPDNAFVRVRQNHIDDVIRLPEKFGLTLAAIKAEYEASGEPLHLEGVARGRILAALLEKGWVRGRARRNFISVNVARIDAAIGGRLRSWIHAMIEAGQMYPAEEFHIAPLDSTQVHELTAAEILECPLATAIQPVRECRIEDIRT